MRRSGRDQHGFAREVLCDAEALQRSRDNLFRPGQAPGADHATGQISAAWRDHVNTAAAQDFKTRLRGRMLPHVDVHGGRDNDRRGGGEIERTEEVVGDALGELRERIAVAGATSNASMDCATEMCSTAESRLGCSEPVPNMLVMTFSPESAAKVRGRTNSWAAAVMMT